MLSYSLQVLKYMPTVLTIVSQAGLVLLQNHASIAAFGAHECVLPCLPLRSVDLLAVPRQVCWSGTRI